MARPLEGKRILVAGVGRGLGTATAVLAAEAGAIVHLAARRPEAVEEAVGLVGSSGGKAHAHACDLADPRAVAALFDAVEREGPIDGILLLAGSWTGGALADTEDPALGRMVAANLTTHLAVLREAAGRLAPGASVTTVSAVFGVAFPSVGQIAYNASKAAAWGLARSAALELMEKEVRVNTVLPGGMLHDYEPGRDRRSMRRLGDRVAPPEDVAKALLWLASDEASWVNGVALPVDGGLHLKP